MAGKLTEDEWRNLDDFRKHWAAFCDCDPLPVEYDFAERMESLGYIELRDVTDDDLEQMFAADLGIVAGGSVWDLTEAGRAALKESNDG